MQSFTSCALRFRFSIIERRPEAPSVAAVKGTLVHRALELLYSRDRSARSSAAALAALEIAADALRADPEFALLELDDDAMAHFFRDAALLVDQELRIEDPTGVDTFGTELELSAEVDGLTLHGIIDRLDRNGPSDLVVVDYKSGRSPSPSATRARLGGVQFYALLCQEALGKRPAEVRLHYLRDRVVVTDQPTDRSMAALRRRIAAVWSAIELACQREDFRPSPSVLCRYCSFQASCPAFGGDPQIGRPEALPR